MSETGLNKEKSSSLLFGLLLSFLGLFLLLFFRGAGFILKLFQSIHGHLGSSGDAGGELIGSSSEGNFAGFTLPNSARNSLDGSLNYQINLPFHMRDRRTWRAVGARIS